MACGCPQSSGAGSVGCRMAHSRLKKFGIVDDLGARCVGEPFAHHAQRFVFDIIGDEMRGAGLGGNFDSQNTRAEAFFVRLFGIERKPHGRFLAGRNRIEKCFQRGGRIKRGIIGGALVDHRSKLLNQRSETQFGVKLAQRGGIGLSNLQRVREKGSPARRWGFSKAVC